MTRPKKRTDRFPSPLKDLRAKFPKGPVVQVRMQLEDGATVVFQGALGAPGTDFDKVVAAVRQVCQENGSPPSEPGHEGKDFEGCARMDPQRGAVHREPPRGKPSAQGSRANGVGIKETKHIVLYQAWEESERGWGVRPDGYSLHIDDDHRKKFVAAFWERQREICGEDTPDEYTRVSGEPVPVNVTATIYKQLVDMGGDYQGSNRDGVRIDEAHNLIAPERKLPKRG